MGIHTTVDDKMKSDSAMKTENVSNEDLRAQLEQTRSDMKILANMAGSRAVESARDVGARAEHAFEDLSDDAAALYEEARRRTEAGVRDLEASMRRHPLLFAGGALALGWLLGSALKK